MCVLIQMHKCKDHKECKLSDACAREPATRGGGAAGTKRKASKRRSGREGVLAAPWGIRVDFLLLSPDTPAIQPNRIFFFLPATHFPQDIDVL